MPLRYTFTDRKALVEHQAHRYACPLLFPTATGQTCPIGHKQWPKGGCVSTMAASIGARLRYQLDRQSQDYKSIYNQRTATERINSQAVELGTPAPALRSGACAGVERPRVRNGQAVTNLNTLIYVLINLRALRRIRQRKAMQAIWPPGQQIPVAKPSASLPLPKMEQGSDPVPPKWNCNGTGSEQAKACRILNRD